MRIRPLALAFCALATPIMAADPVQPQTPFLDEQVSLDSLQWVSRPVVVFADTPNDPRFIQQMEQLQERPDTLLERHVVVMTDTDPAAESDLRMKLRPRGFMLVLIGKDGEIKLRKPSPWDVRELTRVIDKMPMRQQEVRDERRAEAEAEGN